MLVTIVVICTCYCILPAESGYNRVGSYVPDVNYTFPAPNITRLYPKGFSISLKAEDELNLMSVRMEFFAMDDYGNERKFIKAKLDREGDLFVYRFKEFVISKHPHFYYMVYDFKGPNNTKKEESKDFRVWID